MNNVGTKGAGYVREGPTGPTRARVLYTGYSEEKNSCTGIVKDQKWRQKQGDEPDEHWSLLV